MRVSSLMSCLTAAALCATGAAFADVPWFSENSDTFATALAAGGKTADGTWSVSPGAAGTLAELASVDDAAKTVLVDTTSTEEVLYSPDVAVGEKTAKVTLKLCFGAPVELPEGTGGSLAAEQLVTSGDKTVFAVVSGGAWVTTEIAGDPAETYTIEHTLDYAAKTVNYAISDSAGQPVGTYAGTLPAEPSAVTTVALAGTGSMTLLSGARPAGAVIGDREYASLGDALDDAKDGDTVKLLENVTLAANLAPAVGVTLDLNGRTLDTNGKQLVLADGKDLQLANGTLTAPSQVTITVPANEEANSLTLDGLTVTAALKLGDNGTPFAKTTLVTGCTFDLPSTASFGIQAWCEGTYRILNNTFAGCSSSLLSMGTNFAKTGEWYVKGNVFGTISSAGRTQLVFNDVIRAFVEGNTFRNNAEGTAIAFHDNYGSNSRFAPVVVTANTFESTVKYLWVSSSSAPASAKQVVNVLFGPNTVDAAVDTVHGQYKTAAAGFGPIENSRAYAETDVPATSVIASYYDWADGTYFNGEAYVAAGALTATDAFYVKPGDEVPTLAGYEAVPDETCKVKYTFRATAKPFTISWSGEGIVRVFCTVGDGERTEATSGAAISVPAGKTVAVEAQLADWYKLDQDVSQPFDPAVTATLALTATKIDPASDAPLTPVEAGITNGAFKAAGSADVKKVVGWAEAKGVTVQQVNLIDFDANGDPTTPVGEAYLLNCSLADLESAKAGFRFSAFALDAEGNPTFSVTTEGNGKAVLERYEAVSCETKKADGAFMKAFLRFLPANE